MSALTLPSKNIRNVLLPTVLCALLLYNLLPKRSGPELKIKKGISYLPPSKLKDKLQELYPDDAHGEGSYATLPFGRVRYWVVGPESGKKVVLIHGLTIPSVVFREVAQLLSNKYGFRVLLFDLYGRGYTDAPETKYTANLYITQTALLMQTLGWNKAMIAGLSMGGAIAAGFAATFPHLVDGKIVFIASAGAKRPIKFTVKQRLSMSPLGLVWGCSALSRALQRRSLTPMLSTSSTETSSATSNTGKIVALQMALLPGYIAAVTSSLIDGPLRNQDLSFKEIGAQAVKVLLIWGTEDVIVPPQSATILKHYMPQAEIKMFHGAGHDVTVSHATEVATTISEFFSK